MKQTIIHQLCAEFFQVFFLLYVVLVLIEAQAPGSVSDFMDVNYLLPFILVAGIGFVLSSQRHTVRYDDHKKHRP